MMTVSSRAVAGCFLVVLLVASAEAQQADPMFAAARQVLEAQSRNLIAAAERMPADKYDYRPTEGQMTFRHIVAHTAQANYELCSRASGAEPPQDSAVDHELPKEKLVAALQQSFDFCRQAFAQAGDARLGEPVALFGGRQGTRAGALLMATGAWRSHYSMAAMHLRLNGLLPPTAQ